MISLIFFVKWKKNILKSISLLTESQNKTRLNQHTNSNGANPRKLLVVNMSKLNFLVLSPGNTITFYFLPCMIYINIAEGSSPYYICIYFVQSQKE